MSEDTEFTPDIVAKFFNQATFDWDRIVGGIYYPYIPLQVASQPMRFEITEPQYRKFAELIIREAIVACGSEEARYKIAQHFGIEE